MDEHVLARFAAELLAVARGSQVEKAHQHGAHDLALRLHLPPEHPPRRRTLILSASPAGPTPALVAAAPAATRQHSALLEAVRSRLVGATLRGVETPERERILILRLNRAGGEEHRLVLECLPSAPLIVLLDPDLRIVAGLGPGLPGRRRLGTGQPYRPPPPAAASPGELSGLSLALAREVKARAAKAGITPAAARAELEAEIALRPLFTLHRVSRDRVLVAPVRLQGLEGHAEELADALALLEAYHRAVGERLVEAERERLLTALQDRARRTGRTLEKVQGEAAAAALADADRRSGELLLAYQRQAPAGGRVRVPDPERDGEELSIELLEPRASLVENARLYFGRYRRKKRAADALAGRVRLLEAEREHADELLALVLTAAPEDLATLADELRADGIVRRPRALGERRPASRPSTADALRPRLFRGHLGCEILVGRSSRGNDHLTFVLARDDDFWLHADAPGAHVVLRNPRRLEAPDPEALDEASALAAWYSRRQAERKVEVHYTTRRHVRRAPGGPAGRVVLFQRRSWLATPELASRRFALAAGA